MAWISLRSGADAPLPHPHLAPMAAGSASSASPLSMRCWSAGPGVAGSSWCHAIAPTVQICTVLVNERHRPRREGTWRHPEDV